jgi:hypothetical protein
MFKRTRQTPFSDCCATIAKGWRRHSFKSHQQITRMPFYRQLQVVRTGHKSPTGLWCFFWPPRNAMTHEELKVIFEAQARWRRQDAEEYAAEIFERLAVTAADAPVHLLDAYSDVFARAVEVSNAALNDAVEYEEQALRDVGFGSHPQTAAEFIEGFLNRNLSRRAPPYRPKLVK